MTSTSEERIVLVHRNFDLAQVLKGQLERTRVVTEILSLSSSSLEACIQLRPAAIICEIPDNDAARGLKFVRQLRQTTELSQLPIMALLSSPAPESRLEVISAGASDYMLKPFPVGELLHRVEKMIFESTTELAGRLERFKMPDILQLLETNLSTGVLTIDGDQGGQLHFLEGQICAALTSSETGEVAAHALIPLRRGQFHFRRTDIRHNLNAMRSTTELMMDALRRHDERAKAG